MSVVISILNNILSLLLLTILCNVVLYWTAIYQESKIAGSILKLFNMEEWTEKYVFHVASILNGYMLT